MKMNSNRPIFKMKHQNNTFSKNNRQNYYILLAEDDFDDFYLFNYTLEQMNISFTLKTVKNGQELMDLLNTENTDLPDMVFLDINMPIKNGFECLVEIKNNNKLAHLPVIICSNSFAPLVLEQLYNDGAVFYIRKPDEIEQLKKMILKAISFISQPIKKLQPSFENFFLAY